MFVTKAAMTTYVPVFPDLALELSMSCEVPKSESIALGLELYQYTIIAQHAERTDMSLPSSQVRSTLPGLRSKCKMDFSCY